MKILFHKDFDFFLEKFEESEIVVSICLLCAEEITVCSIIFVTF